MAGGEARGEGGAIPVARFRAGVRHAAPVFLQAPPEATRKGARRGLAIPSLFKQVSCPTTPSVTATETTALLHAVRDGDARAADALLPHVYVELRRLAQARIAAEPGAVTVSATGLVHEAYLKLVGGGAWEDRAHFTAVAARAMRQILTDRARARQAAKRGGGAQPITLQDTLVGEAVPERVLAVDEALETLAARDADLARIVEMRFFGGLTVAEIAEATGVSRRTVTRDWARAKAFLHAILA